MNISVFEFSKYKSFLVAWIKANFRQHKGIKSKIARAMDCHSAYVSLVLAGKANLSPEQALKLSRELRMTEEETEYFVLLVQLERAGTKELEKHYENQIARIHTRRQDLKDRFKIKTELSQGDQLIYYSSWKYAATHVLISIPEFQIDSVQRISKALEIGPKTVGEILSFLESRQIIINNNGKFNVGTTRIHLGANSPLISKHHANWRLRSMHMLDEPSPQDLHYSSAVSMSREDLPKVREILVKAIEEVRMVIKDSKDEIPFCYLIDLFPVTKSSNE